MTDQASTQDTQEKHSFSSRYELQEKIATGGAGAVYKGYDRVLNKTVAIKLLLPGKSNESYIRFQKEAKTAARLEHVNIIKVLDFGQTEKGELFLIMEFVEGDSLFSIVENNGPLSLEQALPIFIQICAGLDYAQSHNVLHRDVKPSNVMIAKNDAGWAVTIVDFGIAKGETEEQKLTTTGMRVGSPLYMSPEQAAGGEIDRRSDIYSMGCLMYMTLIGEPPLSSESYMETIRLQIEQDAPRLNDSFDSPKFPEEIEEIIEKALQKDPDQRYQNFDELGKALTEFQHQDGLSRDADDKPHYDMAGSSRKLSRFAKITALVAILSVAFTTYMVTSAKIDAPKAVTARKKARLKECFLVIPSASLESWLIGFGSLHNDRIKELDNYPNTARLVLMDTQLSNSDLKYVRELPLIALDLSNTKVTAEKLGLEALSTLKSIVLNDDPQIDDVSVKSISSVPQLEIVSISRTSVTDEGVKELASMPALRCLDLEGLKGVTGRSLEYLAKSNSLVALRMGHTGIRREDLPKLLKIPHLRYISVENLDITDDDVVTLMKLCPLAFDLSGTNITDRSLKEIAKVNYPLAVDIRGCKNLSDEEIARTNKVLKESVISDSTGAVIDLMQGEGESILPIDRLLNISFWYEPAMFSGTIPAGYDQLRDELRINEKNLAEAQRQYRTKHGSAPETGKIHYRNMIIELQPRVEE